MAQAQTPTWVVYGPAIAAILSFVIVGLSGIVFSILQLKFAYGQPKRDLELHRRTIKAAKYQRLIDDFAIILRHLMATKEYIRLQNVKLSGKDFEEQEKQRLIFWQAESEGLSLAISRAQLEGVGDEIVKIGNEQAAATNKFVTLNKKLFEILDIEVGTDLTYLSNSVNEARILALQKCDELESFLKRKLNELEDPKTL